MALLLAPFNPVPAVVGMASQLCRYADLDAKIQESATVMQDRLSALDGDDRTQYLGPLFWSWSRNIPLCPPRPHWGPHHPTTVSAALADGNHLLPATESFIDAFLDSQSLEALTNEVARWSRSTTRSTAHLSAVQEEHSRFRDEYGKLQNVVERKFGFDDAIALALIAVAGASVGATIHTFVR